MNQGKIWRVVKPTVGVPLFLAAVAVSSFSVHYMLLTHTSWLPGYLQGGMKAAAKTSAITPAATATVAAAETPKKQ